MLRILQLSIPGLLVLCLTSCGGGGGYGGGSSDDDPPPPPPAAVASVDVSPGELTLLAGASLQLAATTLDEAGNELLGRAVTWTTSDSAIATVSEDGLVEGVGAGAVTITATSEDQSGEATIVVISSVTLASVATGGAHSCGLTTDGAAFCWGRAESGQLGVAPPATMCLLDSGAFPCSSSPLGVVGGVEFAQLAAGGAHNCGLTSDGTAYCWGSNVAGQLGDDTTTDRFTPEPVDTDLSFVSIDAGANHTCGLTSDGAAYCWGRNDRGQLGDGTTAQRTVPVAVTGGHTFDLLVAGGFDIGHTCGLTSSGDAYCWGDNERGQLGIGTGGFGSEDVDPHPEPTLIPGTITFVGLTTGLGRHTCALADTGAASCWGENTFGALGDGTSNDSPVPVPVSGGIEFAELIAGGFIGHTCGRTADGTAYCWGENERGQVGDGSNADRFEPSPVAGGLSFSSLDAGFRHTCGRATNDTVYCWGSGAAGQLGTNSTDHSPEPVEVMGQP